MNEDRIFLERLAIRELVEHASDAINHQEWEDLRAFFSEDVVWERTPPNPWVLEGRDAVFGFLLGNAPKLDIRLFQVGATAIQIHDETSATARSTMSEIIRLKESGVEIHVVGTYHDRFEKRDGRWWIVRRTIHPRFDRPIATPDSQAQLPTRP